MELRYINYVDEGDPDRNSLVTVKNDLKTL